MKLMMIIMMMVKILNISGPVPVRTVTLEQLMKPESLLVLDNKSYISQGGSILVFDLDQGTLLNQFGKRGSGPGEFSGVIRIHEMNGHIMVSSRNKVSLFSTSGNLIREMAPHGGMSPVVSGFQPLDSGFAGAASVSDDRTLYRTVNLYNSDLKFVKEIYRSPVGSPLNSLRGRNNFFKRAFSYRSTGNKLYVAGSSGFKVFVFDSEGNPLGSIKRDIEPIPFTRTNRQDFLKYLKENSPAYVYQDMARRIVFPEFFPVIFFLFSDNEILYIFTWGKSEAGLETFLYGTSGKFLGKKYLPVRFSSPVMFSPFTIKGGKMYQLVEDEEETWVLRITPVR